MHDAKIIARSTIAARIFLVENLQESGHWAVLTLLDVENRMHGRNKGSEMKLTGADFTERFVTGAATAAHQIRIGMVHVDFETLQRTPTATCHKPIEPISKG